MSPDLSDLFDRHAAAAFDRQLALAEAIGERDWHIDLASGLLSCGTLSWPVQLLGTESEAASTWRWGWANPTPDIPDRLLGSARVLRLLGEQLQIPELTEPERLLDDVDGHFFALLGSGICRSVAYYRAPYDGGAAFFLLQGESLPAPEALPLARIAGVFPQLLASLPVANHRLALRCYLDYLGLPFDIGADALVVFQDGEPVLTAAFDEWDRLTSLEAALP